jgi:hypothetical protein
MKSVKGDGQFASAEDISGSFQSICNFDASTRPSELSDSLKAMLTASKSRSKTERNEK